MVVFSYYLCVKIFFPFFELVRVVLENIIPVLYPPRICALVWLISSTLP